MQKRRRIAAVLVAAVFLLFSLAVFAFADVQAAHICAGERCHVCAVLETCEGALDALPAAAACAAALCALYGAVRLFSCKEWVSHFSLVSGKVKLSE